MINENNTGQLAQLRVQWLDERSDNGVKMPFHEYAKVTPLRHPYDKCFAATSYAEPGFPSIQDSLAAAAIVIGLAAFYGLMIIFGGN